MSRTLDSLEREGFVLREPDPDALRGALLELITAGTARRWHA